MNDDITPRIEQMLREAGQVLKQMDQPVEVPPHVLAKLRAARELAFPSWKELASKEMEPLLLAVLAKGPRDGFQIINSLEKARIRLKSGGEAENYGVLSKLVAAGSLQVDLEDRDGQMKKIYRITEQGRGLLQRSEAPELQSLTAAVLTAG